MSISLVPKLFIVLTGRGRLHHPAVPTVMMSEESTDGLRQHGVEKRRKDAQKLKGKGWREYNHKLRRQ